MEALFSALPLPVIVFALLLALAICAIILVTYLRERTFAEIRKDVYGLMLKAEKAYKESNQGKQKMKWVISRARLLLPDWLQAIVSDEALKLVLQTYFDEIKDLLDNGHIDGSAPKYADDAPADSEIEE